MASPKALLGGVLGRLFFREATVSQVRDISPHFRRIELEGPALRGVEWQAGDKVQLFLPETGMRTYTPLAWDSEKGRTELFVYLHGSGPGTEWARRLRGAERIQLFGPRRSLALGEKRGAVVLFGDETSFAVASTLRSVAAPSEVTCVFEVSQGAESSVALRELGLEGAGVERATGDTHLSEVHERLRAALLANADARLVMTGRAQSIQALKSRLKAEGLQRSTLVKAYWAVGKSGLD